MLTDILIHNFQSHKQTELKLHSNVNVILGATDAGKSAIFRALMWGLYNRPLGDEFRSYWGGETAVEIQFNEHTISRHKDKSKNLYFLDQNKFTAFGQDPPEEISQVCNLDRNLNIQSQIDPFFLLQSSPGEVARYFNQIAGLEEIDHLTKSLDQHIRKVKQNITTSEQRQAELEYELDQYEGLNQVGEEIKQAEQIQKHIEQRQQSKNYLQHTINRINTLTEKIQESKEEIKAKDLVEECLSLYDKIEQHKSTRQSIIKLVNAISDKDKLIKSSKEKLQQKKDKFHDKMPEQCPLCGQEVK
ncbi:MAG: AAA family ATPase [Candidatus Woesearchaeota archaeon]